MVWGGSGVSTNPRPMCAFSIWTIELNILTIRSSEGCNNLDDIWVAHHYNGQFVENGHGLGSVNRSMGLQDQYLVEAH